MQDSNLSPRRCPGSQVSPLVLASPVPSCVQQQVTWALLIPDTPKDSEDHRPAQMVSLEFTTGWRWEGMIYKQMNYFCAEIK